MADADTIVTGMAGRYASALFMLAKQNSLTDVVAADLKRFDDTIEADSDLQLLVRSPVFGADEQTRALGQVLDLIGIGGLTANFLKLVASKRRLFAVRTMIADYRALNDADLGVARAHVTVAEPLNETHLAALKGALAEVTGGKTVQLETKVDPSLLGGLVVRLGSRMVDASLRTKLNAIRTRMKEVG